MATVMLVEDAADTRDLVTMILEMAGHEVIDAATGEAALEKLARLRPVLILMDISLPGKVSGLDIVKKLRADESFDEIPIIALTAHAMQQDHKNSLAAGCDEHITKPILDLDAFVEIVERFAKNGRELKNKKNVV